MQNFRALRAPPPDPQNTPPPLQISGYAPALVSAFNPIVEKTLSSTVSKGDLIKGILKMVCYDAVPLVFFEGEGFQLLHGKTA